MTEDVSVEVITKTQKTLGKFVKKPPLTEKLLRKPPFRFLHDVIISVVKETGYLKGLFSEDELNSEKVKDKEAKIAFLNKLIEAVRSTTNIDVPVRSTKIVAGLESANTNLLLQAIGTALETRVDSSIYVDKIKAKNGASKVEKPKKTTSKEDKTKSRTKPKNSSAETVTTKKMSSTSLDSSRTKESKSRKSKEVLDKKQADSRREKVGVKEKASPKSNDDSSRKTSVEKEEEHLKIETSKVEDTPAEAPAAPSIETPPEPANKTDQVGVNQADTVGDKKPVEPPSEDFPRATTARPKSARPRSGLSARVPTKSDTLRPPSVRPSSARPGAPRLRPDSALPMKEPIAMGNINVIVENVDVVDDEETVVIESVGESGEVEEGGPVEVAAENKGQLVEQILEQIAEEESGRRVEVEVFRGRDGSKEISSLRELIQKLTKTANPLGKLINYLHEDVDAMQNELQVWSNMKRQLSEEIIKQKKINIEANKPLKAHFEQLQQEIEKQRQEIVMTQSNILRNDVRIKELLTK